MGDAKLLRSSDLQRCRIPSLFPFGTNVYLCFGGDVTAHESLDLNARTARVDLVEPNPLDLD